MVASAILYAVLCWDSCIAAADRKNMDKVLKASSFNRSSGHSRRGGKEEEDEQHLPPLTRQTECPEQHLERQAASLEMCEGVHSHVLGPCSHQTPRSLSLLQANLNNTNNYRLICLRYFYFTFRTVFPNQMLYYLFNLSSPSVHAGQTWPIKHCQPLHTYSAHRNPWIKSGPLFVLREDQQGFHCVLGHLTWNKHHLHWH